MQAIGYTENQTKVIIGLGMQAYCPDKLPKVPEPEPPAPAPVSNSRPRPPPRQPEWTSAVSQGVSRNR